MLYIIHLTSLIINIIILSTSYEHLWTIRLIYCDLFFFCEESDGWLHEFPIQVSPTYGGCDLVTAWQRGQKGEPFMNLAIKYGYVNMDYTTLMDILMDIKYGYLPWLYYFNGDFNMDCKNMGRSSHTLLGKRVGIIENSWTVKASHVWNHKAINMIQPVIQPVPYIFFGITGWRSGFVLCKSFCSCSGCKNARRAAGRMTSTWMFGNTKNSWQWLGLLGEQPFFFDRFNIF